MPMIDDAWQGSVQFWELLFGTWTVYIFLVLLWEKVLRQPLDEWRYILITFIGASFFWVNHYFQNAPFYWWLLNGYTVVAWIAWWQLGVRGRTGSPGWKTGAMLAFWLFTIAFIMFEQVARVAEKNGLHEFWVMLASYCGFSFLIWWRRTALERKQSA
jgi:hypothetical protein